MRPRHYAMEEAYDMGTAGTLSFDLDFSDPITELIMRIEGNNGSTDNKGNPPERCISKIEIVDGGEVLWSANGKVAFASAAHIRGTVGHCYRTEIGSDTPYTTIPIRFGRFLYDPLYAFNPLAHRNPQLKVTFNEATIQTAGNDGYVSDSLVLDLTAQLMEEAPPPTAFLGLREIETFTTTDSGIRRVSMPTDVVYRHLINRCWLTNIDIRNPVNRYRLSADGGKFVPFDLPSDRFADLVASAYPPVLLADLKVLTQATPTDSWMGLDYWGQITGRPLGYIVNTDGFWPSRFYPRIYSHAGVAGTDIGAHTVICGWAIHNTLVYPFGDPREPETWFDAKQFNTLELHLTNGDASAEDNVVVEQVYQY